MRSLRPAFRVFAWQESPHLHFARRAEANKNPDSTDPCSHDCPLEFQHLRMTRQALGVETIAALTLFGGHDLGTVFELAMEAVRTGHVSNLPLQCRR